MNPLSTIKFYLNNKRRFVPLFAALMLSTFLLYMVRMLLDSMFLTSYNAKVEPQRYYSSITSKGRVIDNDLLEEIKGLDGVDSVLPWVFRATNFYSNIGGNIGTKVFTMMHDDMLVMMDKLGLSLKEGRLPEPGSREIVLHYRIARNKNLKIGDKIGSNTDKEESLQGERILVGLLDGKSLVSFDSLETWMTDNHIDFAYRMGLIALPKPGMEAQVYQYFDSLHITGMEVRTFDSISIQNERDTQNIKTVLTFMCLLIVIIVSLCAGFLCYIYFMQRRQEFGLLNAMGYSRQFILARCCREIGVLNLLGYTGGVVLSVAAGYLIDLLAYAPRGQILQIGNRDCFVTALSIPLFTILFGIIPIWRMLQRLEPVSVLEGGLDA